jgi:hypothetical protein
MPKNPSTHRANRREPVPVGLFLALTHRPRRCPIDLPGVPDWHGLSPGDVAYLIRHYTRFGDVVLDLDEHPTVAAAARYLRRAPAKLVTHGATSRVRLVPPRPNTDRPRRVVCRPGPGADLIMVTLPRPEADRLDLHAMTHAMSGWRRLLRPGGHLIAALTARGPAPSPEPGTEPGTEFGLVSHRSTVIAAARAAGLLYHQHIPVLLVRLPEHDPRAHLERDNETDSETDGGPGSGRRLLAGRHLPAFRDLVAFASTATGEETTCV